MTLQEIFDTAVGGLLRQGVKAAVVIDYGISCRYRVSGDIPGDKVLRCAVGQLIPDSLYDADLEGASPWYVLDFNRDLREHVLGGLSDQDRETALDLLYDLQDVHDQSGPEVWADRFRKVAADYRLSSAVLGS